MRLRPLTLLLPVALLIAAAPASPALAAPVAPAASDPAVVDVTPTTSKLSAKKRHTRFFAASFQAEAGEVRFVGTELVVEDAKNTAPDTLFLGVTLSCTSPSGRVTSAEAGRNVWPAGSDFVIPVSFTFQTDVAGRHTCAAEVMMCVPGNCNAPTGVGVVSIVTQKMNPKSFSLLYVSTALPSWARSVRVPDGGDQLIKPRSAFKGSGTFDVSQTSGPVRVGGIISVTNCIEKSFPTACKGAASTAIRGSARATASLRLTQVATTPGTICATADATRATGAGLTTITWQQHHAILSIFVRDFELSSDPGCSTSIRTDLTIQAGKGNAIVVEPGSKAKISSILYAIPGDVIP